MRELALFAGAGGGILGGKLLGWHTVCAVELSAYRARRLMQRQNEGHLPPFPIWDDVSTFDGTPWRGLVDVVSGGFPCQDISCANPSGAGLDGARSGLWREMARIIGEVRPSFVLVENSPRLRTKGLDRVLADLAGLGFDARWGIVSALDAGAPHLRKRLWIVAHAPQARCEAQPGELAHADSAGQWSTAGASGGDVPHTEQMRRQGGRPNAGWEAGPATAGHGRQDRPSVDFPESKCKGLAQRQGQAGQRAYTATPRGPWWPIEPRLGRVAHGVAHRVDRIEAIGDGQVPRVVAAAFRLLVGDR
jgi:DNA (cytosine-5)-methyltransferase 1